jgi:NAD dependent epimerase/dehydratase
MNWNHRTVLVTGAGGFIGSHLTERLVELGARTRALVRYNSVGSWGWLDHSPVKDDIEITIGDVRDRDSLRQAIRGADMVFHLAALISIPYSYQSPLSYIRTNVEGTANVLQLALEENVGLVVHTSTSEVFGTARTIPIDENHVLQGQSPYSATKIGADKLAEAYRLSFGLPVATIRPFNAYGPRQSARAIIPTIITQAQTQPFLSLGSLDPTRDFTFVADTVQGYIHIAEHPEAIGEVINVGSGQEISIGDLANLIMRLVGRDIPIVADKQRMRPPDSEVERLCADNSKAKRIIDWNPRVTLTQGLISTIEWMDQNLHRYRPEVYSV